MKPVSYTIHDARSPTFAWDPGEIWFAIWIWSARIFHVFLRSGRILVSHSFRDAGSPTYFMQSWENLVSKYDLEARMPMLTYDRREIKFSI